jgi:uncharacterized protein (DUF1015 family)
MALVVPFAALRPVSSSAARVAAVPYDVVTTEEARALAAREPLSFLHVSRAEVDLPRGTNPYGDEVYARAVTNLEGLKQQAPLLVEESGSFYVYRLEMNGHRQTGVAAAFSLDEYERNLIKRHERTRREKEDDRTRHIVELRAQTGPVFLVHRSNADVERATSSIVQQEPMYDFVADDRIRHTIWRAGTAASRALQGAFTGVDALYIADGHHRAASAARAQRELGVAPLFLAVAFPQEQVQILAYNRVVRDLGAHSAASFVEELRARVGAVEGPPVPRRSGEASVFVDGRWYTIALAGIGTASPAASGVNDTVERRLDVSRLHDLVLAPLLGIGDVTRDRRIDFVGGGRGTAALERMVLDGEAAVAFSMHPVGIDDVLQVSDAGGIMPPKSTWFEPKLRDGLLSYLI